MTEPAVGMLEGALFDFIERAALADDSAQLAARYLDGIGAFVGSSAAGFYVLGAFEPRAQEVAARGVSDFFLARYEQAGRPRDPVLAWALEHRRAIANDDLLAPDAWTSSELYGEVFGLQGMVHLLEAPVIAGGQVLGTLNFGRTAQEPRFAERDRLMAETVGRLLGVALESIRRRQGVVRERDRLVAALELSDEPMLVTDLELAERRVSESARRLLDRIVDPRPLERLLADAEAAGPQGTAVAVDGGQALLRVRSAAAGERGAARVTFLALDAPGITAGVDGLTAREQAVADLAVAGLRDREIADRLCLSPHTVKEYLRAVYRKAGVRSRTELAARATRRLPG